MDANYGHSPRGKITHCPICNAPCVVETTETGVNVQHVAAVDPSVLLRAAEALRTVARSLAGGTSTTMMVAQMDADETELRMLAERLRGR